MYQIAYNLEIATAVLALLVLVFVRGKGNTLLASFIIFVILVDLFSRAAIITLPNGQISNHYYYNLARIPEILALIWIWYSFMGERLQTKLLPLILTVGWLSFAMLNLFVIQGLFILNTHNFLFASLIIIALSAVLLFVIVEKESRAPQLRMAAILFWAGLLISNVFSFTYRVFEPLTHFNNSLLFKYSIVVGAIIKYLFISIAFILMLINRFSATKNGHYHTSGA